MMNRIVLVAAVLSACGSEDRPKGSQIVLTNAGKVPISLLATNTDIVKVVVKSTQVVYIPVVDHFDGDDNPIYATCAAESECAKHQDATCHDGICSIRSNVYGTFYATNFAKGEHDAVALPCDGRDYVVEVYGAVKGNTNSIQESWRSAILTPPVSTTSCSLSSDPGWASLSTPTFRFPTIYAGLPAPYDTFTVAVENLQYPWAAGNWSAACDGTKAISTAANSAVFAAPRVPGPFTCEGTFHLDRSTLVAGEVPWELEYTSPPQTPVPSGDVGLP